MIKFFLADENDNNKEYSFNINFNIEEFEEYYDVSPEFAKFMEKMECSRAPWSGVHDVSGDETSWGYSSYEIQDFPTAIQMWKDFFKSEGKLIN